MIGVLGHSDGGGWVTEAAGLQAIVGLHVLPKYVIYYY